MDNAWVEETVIPIYDDVNGLAREESKKVLKIEVRMGTCMGSWLHHVTYMHGVLNLQHCRGWNILSMSPLQHLGEPEDTLMFLKQKLSWYLRPLR